MPLLCCSAVCDNGDVRLMNGSLPSLTSGRVEICFNNSFGLVCGNRWDQIDALVVCRQLSAASPGEGVCFQT